MFVSDTVPSCAGEGLEKIWLRLKSAMRAWSRACSWSVIRCASGTSSMRRKSRQEAARAGSLGEKISDCGRDIVVLDCGRIATPYK